MHGPLIPHNPLVSAYHVIMNGFKITLNERRLRPGQWRERKEQRKSGVMK